MKFQDQTLLPASGLYKANLHCHSTVSDGRLSPEEVKAVYQKEGYSIVAFTDHRTYNWHRELDDENFLALAALEVDLNQTSGRPAARRTYHLNLFDTCPTSPRDGLDLLPRFPYEDKAALNDYIARMNDLGFLVCYNHPYWSLQDIRDYSGLKGLFAMEIYNHGCETEGLYGFHSQSYDEMLRDGQKLFALATDDNHNGFPFDTAENDSFGGFISIAAESLSYQTVIDALKKGRFYWSTGPQLLGVEIREDVLHVTCSPAEKIFLVQEGRNYLRKQVLPGETITHAEFPLSGEEGWIRVQIKDAQGRFAGTNAYFISDLVSPDQN